MKIQLPWLVAAMLTVPFVHGQDATEIQEETTTTETSDQVEVVPQGEVLDWVTEGTGEMRRGSVEVPAGYSFVAKEGADKLLESWGNLSDPTVEGLVVKDDAEWVIIYDFENIGYVKDDEKDEISSEDTQEEMLEAFKEGQEYANTQLEQRGLPKLFVEGWAVKPFYNDETNMLEYGLLLRDEAGEKSVNYTLQRLGRRGVTNITLLCNPDELEATIPEARKFNGLYEFNDGEKYAEYKDGDKLAEYGLIGLATGGALLGAAKLGWLAKLGKLGKGLIIGVIAVFAGLWKGIKKLVGRA